LSIQNKLKVVTLSVCEWYFGAIFIHLKFIVSSRDQIGHWILDEVSNAEQIILLNFTNSPLILVTTKSWPFLQDVRNLEVLKQIIKRWGNLGELAKVTKQNL
jgi:hypothetical protein